jgi:hypothetical protein
MSDTHQGKSLLKILLGMAAILTAIMVGKKVMKEARKRKTQEEY